MLGWVLCSLVSCEIETSSSDWINRSLVSLWANLGFLIVGYSVGLSLFWIKDSDFVNLLRPIDLVWSDIKT